MSQSVSATGGNATVSGSFIGNFLKYVRDTSNQIFDDTSGDPIREPDAPVFTATGGNATQTLPETGPT